MELVTFQNAQFKEEKRCVCGGGGIGGERKRENVSPAKD